MMTVDIMYNGIMPSGIDTLAIKEILSVESWNHIVLNIDGSVVK